MWKFSNFDAVEKSGKKRLRRYIDVIITLYR